MTSNAISSLNVNYLQSTPYTALRGTGSTSRDTGINATSPSQTSDSGQLSPFAQLVSTLQGLQQSNPDGYQQLTERIGTNLEVAAQTAQANGNTTSANQLNLLASDFTTASLSGQLPNLKDLAEAVGGNNQHHYHYSEETAVANPASSSSTSNTTAASNSSNSAAGSSSSVPASTVTAPSVATVTSSTSAVGHSSTTAKTGSGSTSAVSSSPSHTGNARAAGTTNSTNTGASITTSKVGSSNNSLSAILTSLKNDLSQLQQFLSSSQSNTTQNNSQSLNPLAIILGTLSSAGVNGGYDSSSFA